MASAAIQTLAIFIVSLRNRYRFVFAAQQRCKLFGKSLKFIINRSIRKTSNKFLLPLTVPVKQPTRLAPSLIFLVTAGFLAQLCHGQTDQGFQAIQFSTTKPDQANQVNKGSLEDRSKDAEDNPSPTTTGKDDSPSAGSQQPRAGVNTGEEVSLESIDAELEKVNALPESDSPVIAETKSFYQKAKLQINEAKELQASLAQFNDVIKTAPEKLEQTQTLLNQTDGEPKLAFNAETPVEKLPELKELESQKLDNEIQIKSINKSIEDLAPAQRQTRVTAMQGSLTEVRAQLEEVELQLKTPPAKDNQFFIRARRTQLLAERKMLRLKVSSLEAESDSYDATADLPAIKMDYNRKLVMQLTKEITIIDGAINRRRQNEIDRIKSIAIETQRNVIEPLQKMAGDNVRLTERLRKLADDIDKFSKRETAIQAETARIEREQTTTESRIRVVGLSDSFGRMLQRNRNHLIDAQQKHTPINQLNRDIADAQIAMFHWEDESELITNLEASAKEIVETLKRQGLISLPEATTKLKEETKKGKSPEEIALADSQKLLTRRTMILGELKKLEDQRFQELVGNKAAQVELEKVSGIYAELIDENILWVRNAPPMGFSDVNDIGQACLRLASPTRWHSVWENIRRSISQQFPTTMLIIMSSMSLFMFRHRMVAELNRTGDRAIKRGCRMFGITLSAFVQTILLAVTKLSPLLALGWLLSRNTMASQFSTSFGWALIWAFLISLPFELLNQSCRKNGLVHSHFDWTEERRLLLKRNFDWMFPIALPLLVILLLLPLLGNESANGNQSFNASAIANLIDGGQVDTGLGDESSSSMVRSRLSNSEPWNRLGRLTLLGLLLIAAVFSASVFHPKGDLYDRKDLTGTNNSRTKLEYLGYLVAIGIPIVLAAIAMVGYYYSSIRIGESLVKTIALAIVIILLYAGAMRFLLVRRRNLRYEQLVHQRNQARIAAEQKDAAVAAGTPSDMIEIDLQNEPGLDITDVSRQARELTAVIFLLIAGGILLSIWQYLLPATKIMDDIQLWPVQIAERTEHVSLRDVIFSAIMFAMTYFGVRNMPGMLELLLLQRLPLDAGARYAVTSIFRYILLVFGAVLALGYLKIPWSDYSWLVAAISVGLGFGLQEIVANFVSGLILLLERPVRVGDVVTIDGTTGIVSRIQMRATTVTNWDNQELIVPNKDLISDKLLNWTLSSVVNRISLQFGVAYGTDPVFVRQIVLDAINSNRALLKEPKPMVTFEEFGDSSLNFTLRCCISTIERRWPIIHELNVAINSVLKEHDIEIPFPQRDLHIIDGSSPLEITDKNADAEK